MSKTASDSDEADPLEALDFCQVMPEPFPAAGRICCDAAEGRLNAKSIVLQGSQVKSSFFDLKIGQE